MRDQKTKRKQKYSRLEGNERIPSFPNVDTMFQEVVVSLSRHVASHVKLGKMMFTELVRSVQLGTESSI